MAKVIVNKFSGYRNYLSGDLTKKLDITNWTISEVPEGLRYDKPTEHVAGAKSWLIVSQTPATDTSPAIQTVQYFKLGYREESALQFTVETETTDFELPRTDDLIGYLLRDNDVVEGTTWHDKMIGGDGDDILHGYKGYDFIDGGAGDDVISGGDLSDELIGGAGADTIDGGDGYDTLSYVSSKEAVMINLIANTYSGGDAEGDRVSNVEKWVLSDHDDLMIGSEANDKIVGGKGNDLIFGNKGRDIIRGDDGDDTLVMGEGSGSLHGGNGNDALFAGDQGTEIRGGSGNDWIVPGEGKDNITGDEGIDWISFTNADNGVNVSLSTDPNSQISQTGIAKDDIYRSIENIHGSSHDDTLISSDGDGTIVGWSGNDRIVGSDGSNTLLGDKGHDQMFGGNGNDFVLGGVGNDFVSGGHGNDYIDGGDGDDFLTGATGTNLFFDGKGNDRVFGGEDNDYFVMGGGKDTVYGGGGNDMVRVSTTGNTFWRDFQSGENRLDLTYTNITRSEFQSTAVDSAEGLALKTGDGWITLTDTTLETFDFDDDVLYNITEASSEAEL